MNIQKIEADLTAALKERNQTKIETLRGLKARITTEQIAKGGELSEDDILKLIASEAKRRQEAAAAFEAGNREELAQKEKAELEILKQYLPAQVSEQELVSAIDSAILEHGWKASDFGVAMKTMKEKFGQSADGALLANLIKQKLNS